VARAVFRVGRGTLRQAFAEIRSRQALVLASSLLLLTPSAPSAHEIPSTVIVIAFIKPEGDRLRVVVRVPLEAMRDVDFPVSGPGYLDLARSDSLLRDAATVWIADAARMYENDRRLDAPRIAATRISIPSDRAFDTYAHALANTSGPPLPAGTELVWRQAMLDVVLEYAITSDSSRFAIDPEWARLGVRTTTVLRFITRSGTERAFEYVGDPGLVRLEPRWYHAAARFTSLGFHHILDGIDHLLFVFCLVIPFRRLRTLIAIVTSFTVAHSLTLLISAAGFAPGAQWFPPLIEVLIAVSILYMAFENIVGARIQRRWLVAFAFGLVHGFGFSFALRDSLQFAGGHLATALLTFNIGVELGQVFVLVLAVPVLNWLFSRVVAERVGTIILSALVAHTAWHWMLDRFVIFRAYPIEWPAFDQHFALSLLRAVLLLVLVGGTGWLMYDVLGRVVRAKGASMLDGAEKPTPIADANNERRAERA
jgi:hypothetical protein